VAPPTAGVKDASQAQECLLQMKNSFFLFVVGVGNYVLLFSKR
jgi:hypothetical protein